MTSLRRFKLVDVFRFNPVNLDHLTENYNIPYYSHYLYNWPNCFVVAEQPGNTIENKYSEAKKWTTAYQNNNNSTSSLSSSSPSSPSPSPSSPIPSPSSPSSPSSSASLSSSPSPSPSSLSSLSSSISASLPRLCGYMMGKVEGKNENWHGHVSAVSVSPSYRRQGVANVLMSYLESVSEHCYNGYFVDLYVRKSNSLAIDMYKKMNYIVYREVIGYYSGEDKENAYDMRKALRRDVKKKSIIPITEPVMPDPNWD